VAFFFMAVDPLVMLSAAMTNIFQRLNPLLGA